MTEQQYNKFYVNFKSVYIKGESIKRLKPLLTNYPKDKNETKKLISGIKKEVTKVEAIKDIEDFFLLIKYCYSGYEYFSSFVDFDNIKEKTIKIIQQKKENLIKVCFLGELLYEVLEGHINDGHFSLVGFGSGNLSKPWRAYVTDVVVNKVDDCYKVIKGTKNLPKGTTLDNESLKGKLLPTLVSGYENVFLIGVYSKEEHDVINVGNIKLKTHLIKSDHKRRKTKYNHKFVKKDKYNIFYSKSYNIFNNQDEVLKEYYDFGRKSKTKNSVIFDITNNYGGNSNFPKMFIEGLNDYAYWQIGSATMVSPIFDEKASKKDYIITSSLKEYDYSKSKYQGKLYVVTNKQTASSGESAISYAKSIKDAIVVGSASAGIGEFGDIKLYQLFNSKILFYFGHKIFHMKDYEEGKGFLPDYWLDEKDPVKYLINYFKKQKGK